MYLEISTGRSLVECSLDGSNVRAPRLLGHRTLAEVLINSTQTRLQGTSTIIHQWKTAGLDWNHLVELRDDAMCSANRTPTAVRRNLSGGSVLH